MTIDGSPTRTTPNRWWIAHRIREDIDWDAGWWFERNADSCAVRIMFAMVLIASLLYAWYSRRVTVLPEIKVENRKISWASQEYTFKRVAGCANKNGSCSCTVVADRMNDLVDIQSLVGQNTNAFRCLQICVNWCRGWRHPCDMKMAKGFYISPRASWHFGNSNI